MLDFLFTSIYSIIALNIGISLGVLLIGVPYIQKKTIKTAFKRLNSSKGGLKAIDGKIDKALLTRAVNDLLSPENPAGLILGYFPSVSTYLKQNPESVIGAIRLMDNLQGLGGIMAKAQKNQGKPTNINSYDDYTKYK
jgi:uncharacterized protein YneF (UPF0154 family)